MMGLDNPIHIAFLLVLLLLVFGAKRLPEMGHSLGAGLRGFKESISGESPVVHAEPMRLAGAPEMSATTSLAGKPRSWSAARIVVPTAPVAPITPTL